MLLQALEVFGIMVAASSAQALSGFGSALLAVPLISVMVGAKAAVVGTSLAGTLISLLVLLRDGRAVGWRTVAVALGASFAGMPIGLLVLARIDGRILQGTIGALVIVSAFVLARGWTLRVRGTVVDAGAGFVSGVLATSTGTSGPPLVVALQARGLEPVVFRATLAGVFFVQSVATVVAFAAAGQVSASAGRVFAAAAPAVLVGWALGDRVFARLDRARFRWVVLAMLAGSGALALVAAIR